MDQAETIRLDSPLLREGVYELQRLFEPVDEETSTILSSPFFTRRCQVDSSHAEFLLDEFPDTPGAACCFVRLPPAGARTVSFVAHGAYRVDACAAGGWLIRPRAGDAPTYWFPRAPILRTQDAHGHITAEQPVSLAGLGASADELAVTLEIPSDWQLDWPIWRFMHEQSSIPVGLERPLHLERQYFFLWGSKANVSVPAGVYLYLLHGQVYTDAFVWPRKWKFHSELDAHGLYGALGGLEVATRKTLYRLLKRQVLYSVIGQQAEDGGWYQGEWTDLMESHYRLHNAAMLLLEAGFEETGDAVVRTTLERAAAFLAQCTDRTDIGTWFLHDSLEASAEAMEEMRRQTRTPWIPSHTLGKSPTNKLILNTHLDAIVTLDRYRQVTGDDQYGELMDSARAAARTILALRPAEPLYRVLYWAIHLSLLPKAEAMRLPLPLKIIKRLAWMYLAPQMHRVKRIFPRLVMPGGLIERHVAPMHHDINYHPVNILDLVRYARCYPAEAPDEIIEQAIQVVVSRNLLEYWSEQEYRRFALVVWADALYHLCTLNGSFTYRRHLAEGMLRIEDAELGLPPAILGCESEVIAKQEQMPCPSPADHRLRVANLSHRTRPEILVVNPSAEALPLVWERMELPPLSWVGADGKAVIADDQPPVIPARGWMLGKQATDRITSDTQDIHTSTYVGATTA